MRNSMLASAIIVVLFLLTSVALAQDTPPPGDPKDNVCYEGGMWDDGRCNIPPHVGSTELAWECGWYMARILDGRLPVTAMPSQCVHVMTAIQKAQAEGVAWPICVLVEPEELGKLAAKPAGNLWCRYEDGTVTVDYNNDGGVDHVYTFQPSDSPDDCSSSVGHMGISYEFSWITDNAVIADESGLDLTELAPYACEYDPEEI